jgi:hypothetical protein
MHTLIRDVRYAIRQLVNAPVFFMAAVGTLGIGIGATTAIFSTVNATLLRPLPFPQFEDLVAVRTRLTDGRVTTGLAAPVEIVRLNDPQLSIVRAAGYAANPFELTLLRDGGSAVRVSGTGVTEGFFELLGLPMTLGAGFTHEHHVQITGSAPIVVVLSHRVWAEMFGSRPDIIGRLLRLAEDPDGAIVAGVAARTCDFPHGTDFWYSVRTAPQSVVHFLNGLVRVRPGTRVERLRAEVSPVMAALAREFPDSNKGREYVVDPLVRSMVGDLRSILLIVLGATFLLLGLASVNLTNLLLARGVVRGREVAVRAGWHRDLRHDRVCIGATARGGRHAHRPRCHLRRCVSDDDGTGTPADGHWPSPRYRSGIRGRSRRRGKCVRDAGVRSGRSRVCVSARWGDRVDRNGGPIRAGQPGESDHRAEIGMTRSEAEPR